MTREEFVKGYRERQRNVDQKRKAERQARKRFTKLGDKDSLRGMELSAAWSLAQDHYDAAIAELADFIVDSIPKILPAHLQSDASPFPQT